MHIFSGNLNIKSDLFQHSLFSPSYNFCETPAFLLPLVEHTNKSITCTSISESKQEFSLTLV